MGAGGYISHASVERVFDTAQIEEVIGEFVTLKKRGVNYLGLCPFHDEKTSSFTVSPAKGIYKCFGCGKAGNAVNFVMEHEHKTYPGAIEWLANKYHIPIEHENEDNPEFKIWTMLQDTTRFYQEEFKGRPYEYLRERGFTDETLIAFKIGYAKNGSSLRDHLLSKGYKLDQMVQAGVLNLKKEGNPAHYRDYFDPMWERIMFPIMRSSGYTSGFGGRHFSLETGTKREKESRKYINTKDTKFFKKRFNLYGFGTPTINKLLAEHGFVLLPEGYTDVMMIQQEELPSLGKMAGPIVASQLQPLIKGHPDITPLPMTDGDYASLKLISGNDLRAYAKKGLLPDIITMPEGQDPAVYFRNTQNALRDLAKLKREPATIFFISAQKALATKGLSEDAAAEKLNDKHFKRRLMNEAMSKYINHYESTADILELVWELEETLGYPKEVLVTKAFELEQEKIKTYKEKHIIRNIKEETLNDYLISLLVADKGYAQHLFKMMPVTHQMFTKEQQELYTSVKRIKEDINPQFATKQIIDKDGMKKTVIKKSLEQEEQVQKHKEMLRKLGFKNIRPEHRQDELFKDYFDDLSTTFKEEYDKGRLRHMPTSLILKAVEGFDPDVDKHAAGLQEIMNDHQQPRLFNEMWQAWKEGDEASAKHISDLLNHLYTIQDKTRQ